MSRHFVLLAILSLLLMLFQIQSSIVQAGTVIQVPGDYPTIQEAVHAAASGDTIEVSPGVYYENIVVNQSLTLQGQDKSTTIIDGSGIYTVLNLNASSITVSGFTIRNGGNYAGITANSFGGHTITDNILLNNVYGIDLFESNGNTAVNNTLLNNAMIGIHVGFSSGNNISNNYISQSTYGIKLEGVSQSNSVVRNAISDASYGIHVGYSPNNNIDQNNVSSQIVGIRSVYSDSTNIRNNTVSGCAYGIQLHGSASSTILGNTVADNGYGIYLAYSTTGLLDSNLASNNGWGIAMYESNSNTITQNTASYNTYGINIASYSTGNTIAWNNLINNRIQMDQDFTSWTNMWFKAYQSQNYGNYWSDYTGEDTNGDGVGDTMIPHAAVDNYPLINPWGTVHDVAIVSVETSSPTVYEGQIVNITVVARNEGTETETFTVTAKYLDRAIETKTVTNLARYESTTLVFNWDTTGVPTGFNYPISAEANVVTGETDLIDNTLNDGTIKVKLPGDVNGDGIVDIFDVGLISAHWYPGPPVGPLGYDPEADFNLDGAVDIFDIGIASANWG